MTTQESGSVPSVECREAFEQDCKERGICTKKRDDPYQSADYYFRYETEQRWQTWQAAWNRRTEPSPAAPITISNEMERSLNQNIPSPAEVSPNLQQALDALEVLYTYSEVDAYSTVRNYLENKAPAEVSSEGLPILAAKWEAEADGAEDEKGYVRGSMFTFAQCAKELRHALSQQSPARVEGELTDAEILVLWNDCIKQFETGWEAQIIRFARTLNQRLAVKEGEGCAHRIADARNPRVQSGYICVDCCAVFASADHGDTHPVSNDQQSKDAALSFQPIQVNIGVKNGEN